MKLCISLFLFSVCISCKAQINNNSGNALQLTMVMPLHDNDNNVFDFKREIILVERGSLFIFKIPTYHQTIRNASNDYGEYDSELVRVDSFYYYVMYKQGQRFGYFRDSAKGINWTKIPVDSFRLSATIYSLDTLVDYIGKKSTLVSSSRSDNGNLYTEKYASRSKPDSTYNDSTLVIYNRDLNKYKFSFSRQADQKHEMKLAHVELIYNPNHTAETGYLRSRRSILFKMHEVTLPNPEFFGELESIYRQLETTENLQ